MGKLTFYSDYFSKSPKGSVLRTMERDFYYIYKGRQTDSPYYNITVNEDLTRGTKSR